MKIKKIVSKPLLKRLFFPGIVAAVLVFIFVGIVGGALHKPAPKDLPIAIMAPEEIVKQINTAVRAQTDNMVQLQSTDNLETAQHQLKERQIYGIMAPGQGGFELYLTSASGEATRQVVTQFGNMLSQAYGQPLQINDLTPAASGAGHFMIILFLFLLSAIGSFLVYALIRRDTSLLPKQRFAAAVIGALLIGFSGAVTAAMLGEFQGSFWEVGGILSLSALACGSIIVAFHRLAGRIGLAAAGLLLVPLGIATSGALMSVEFLPPFYAAIAPYMPSAATVDALRSGIYLDNLAIMRPLGVLALWIVGSVLIVIGSRFIGNKDTKSTTKKPKTKKTKRNFFKKKSSK